MILFSVFILLCPNWLTTTTFSLFTDKLSDTEYCNLWWIHTKQLNCRSCSIKRGMNHNIESVCCYVYTYLMLTKCSTSIFAKLLSDIPVHKHMYVKTYMHTYTNYAHTIHEIHAHKHVHTHTHPKHAKSDTNTDQLQVRTRVGYRRHKDGFKHIVPTTSG